MSGQCRVRLSVKSGDARLVVAMNAASSNSAEATARRSPARAAEATGVGERLLLGLFKAVLAVFDRGLRNR